MPSSYSDNLKIELIANGEQDNTWGNTTNTNLGTAIEQAIVGRAIVTFSSDADVSIDLTTSNAAQDARAVYLVAQSGVSLTNSRNLIVPTIFKNYVVKNATTGGQNIIVKTSSGTGVTIPNGRTVAVYVDGTNVIQESNHFNDLSAVSPAFSGTPTAPTASPGTNTTQIATTAFVQNVAGALGTLSTQNADNVAITGGSISGITDLAVGDGGTGASTAVNARTNLGLGTGDAVTFNTVSDASGNVRDVPQNPKTSGYTLIASDNGKHISITTGGIDVPSGVFSAGQSVTIYNNSTSSQTITQGSGVTMYLVGTSTTGNRTLSQRGLATVFCVASNTFVVTGGGIS